MILSISKSLILFFLIFYLPTISAQVETTEQEIGVCTNGQKVIANIYQLEERIHSYHVDSLLKGDVLLQLRGLSKRKNKSLNRGQLVSLNLNDGGLSWTKAVNYEIDEIIYFNETIVKEVSGHIRKAYLLDPKTGSATKELTQKIFHVTEANVGLGYSIKQESNSDLLYAVDLEKNERLWNREINRKFGVNELVSIDDSTLVISAAGIHSLNLKNEGRGISYNDVTGTEKELLDQGKVGVVSLAFGIVGAGVYIALGGGKDDDGETVAVITGVESNVLIYKTDVYKASSDRIYKVDQQGNQVWENKLPTKFTSNSSLFVKDEKLFLVNNAYAFKGRQKYRYGKPFFMCYDLETGEKVFSGGIIQDEINAFVKDMKIDSTLALILNNNISLYSFEDGSLYRRHDHDLFGKKQIISFLKNDIYLPASDSTFYNYKYKYPSYVFVRMKTNEIYVLNGNLKLKEIIHFYDEWSFVENYKEYTLLRRGNAALLINRKGEKKAEFSLGENPKIIKDLLFSTDQDKLIVLDLSKVVRKKKTKTKVTKH